MVRTRITVAATWHNISWRDGRRFYVLAPTRRAAFRYLRRYMSRGKPAWWIRPEGALK